MKKLNISIFYFCAIGMIILNSCSHHYYAPNSHNIPLFQKKQEVRVSASKCDGEYYEGYEIQGAYAVTNNIGLIGNIFVANPEPVESYNHNWGKGHLWELGAGYFKPIDKFGVFEAYAGAGYSEQFHSYKQGVRSSLAFNRFFIQPSIGYTLKSFDVALSARFCGVYFTKINYDNNVSSTVRNDLEYIKSNRLTYMIEPALTVRAGWKYVKLQGQAVLSKNDDALFPQAGSNLNCGIYIVITDKYK